ncbi:M28 family metallopeptidase [Kribbella albertanoniae]
MAMAATIKALTRIGPREATSTAYATAADYTEARLRALGYQVRRQSVPVPAGTWQSFRLRAGTTTNLVAALPTLSSTQPRLLVGAHLDTVPDSPGANDNASGVAALLELARLAAASRSQPAIVFIVFGGEEPRRPRGSHFGSKAYAATLDDTARRTYRGMISLDAVGTGSILPVCRGRRLSDRFSAAVVRRAKEVAVSVTECTSRASDHLSFEDVDLPAVVIGGRPYSQYHTIRDRPSVLRLETIAAAVRLTWAVMR